MPASGVKKPTIMSSMFSEEEEDEDGEEGDGREEEELPLCCGSVAESSLWFCMGTFSKWNRAKGNTCDTVYHTLGFCEMFSLKLPLPYATCLG